MLPAPRWTPVDQAGNKPRPLHPTGRAVTPPRYSRQSRTPNRQVKLEDRRCGSTRIRTSFRKNSSTRCRTWPVTTRTWASACARCRRCSMSMSARRSWMATRTISRSCPTRSRRSRSSPRLRRKSTRSFASSMTASPSCAPRRRTTSPAGSRRFRSMRPTPGSPRRSAQSRWARSACRSTPTSRGSRSTGRNTCRSGRR